MTKNLLQHYNGLYGDQSLASTLDFMQCETLEWRSKTYNWEISPHFHSDLLQIFIFSSGSGTVKFENDEIIIQSPSVVVIPANIIHGFKFEKNITGEVFTLSMRFADQSFTHQKGILHHIFKQKQVLFNNQISEFEKILLYYRLIQEELLANKKEQHMVLDGLFRLLIIELFRSRFEEERLDLLSKNKALAYFQQFQLYIKRNVDQNLSVNSSARELGITEVHLNRICREVIGKSALEVIQDQLLVEAKNYLLNTQYSVAEIAYFLNFNDPAYFNRFFKKKIGVSPGVFRKN